MGKVKKLKQQRRAAAEPMTICLACKLTLRVADKPQHSASEPHRESAGRFRLNETIAQLFEWRCPGALVREQRPMPWEAPIR